MIPAEVLKQVRRIEIRTRNLVNDTFSGDYHSVFKGRGMEFAEVREYAPGDDVRAIDWNVTARLGHPYVKQFTEERELTVFLLVDISASGDFGTRVRPKAALAAEMAAVLAFSAVNNNDKVGLILFSDRIEHFLPPRKGKRHVLRVIREILYREPIGRATALSVPLEHLGRVQKRRAVVFLISDFQDQGYESALKLAAGRHDLISVRVSDPAEELLPPLGIVEIEDAETGARRLEDFNDGRVRARFEQRVVERDRGFREAQRGARVESIEVRTDRPYVRPLVEFFQRREKRR